MIRRFVFALALALSAVTSAQADMKETVDKTIVEIAAGDDRFSTLVAAVKAAGLAEMLSGNGPYTVFAPTNGAFDKLPDGTVENLLKPENKDRLNAILRYHVLMKKVMAGDLSGSLVRTRTFNGAYLTVNGLSEGVTAGGASVVVPNVEASNGVIHVIDRVILPPES